MTTDRFAGKVVVATGGGTGIGAATAHRFASDGAVVVVVGRTKETPQKTVAAAPVGSTIFSRVADVSDEFATTAVIDETAAEHGRLDVLVDGAAVGAIGTVADTDTATWRQVLSVVDGTFFASRAAISHLRSVRRRMFDLVCAPGCKVAV